VLSAIVFTFFTVGPVYAPSLYAQAFEPELPQPGPEIVFEEELPKDMGRLIEVVYGWQEPQSSVDEILYKRLLRVQGQRLGCYYYSMYARCKADILAGDSFWSPKRILMGGKDISMAVYNGLIELGQSQNYRFIYYQQTPFGLLKLGHIRYAEDEFNPDIRFVRCVASEIGHQTPPTLWHIGALLSGSLALFDYFNTNESGHNRAPVADFFAVPLTGTTNTDFYFDASASSDPDEPDASGLLVRWDLDGDGLWDNLFTFDKITSTRFASPGVYNVMAQVRDRAGAFSVVTKTVTVIVVGPGPGSTPHSMFRNVVSRTGVSVFAGPILTDAKWATLSGERIEASPSIASDGTVYIGSYDGGLYALSPIDGSPFWISPLAGPVHSSVAIASNGTIYVGAGSYVYAINPADGETLWSYDIGGLARSSPVIDSDGTVYIGSLDGRLYAVNPNGSFKWSLPIGGQVWSSPAIGGDGTVYVGSLDGRLYAINKNSVIKWSYATGGGIYSSPAVGADGVVYFGSWDGWFYAVNGDGSLKWSAPASGPVWSSACLSNGSVLFGADNGVLYCLDAANGSESWSFTAGGRVRSSPTTDSAGRIYFGADDGRLYALDLAGSLLSSDWPVELSSPITPIRSSVAIAGSITPTLYVGSFDKRVYAIGSAALDPADLVVYKSVNKQQVSQGDMVTYRISVFNQGPDPTSGTATSVIDAIPPGFKFASGSARLDGTVLPDPSGLDSGTLVFDVGHFAPGLSKTLIYQLVVGSGLVPGRYVNRARARYFYDQPPLTESFSPEVNCPVWVVPDPLFDLGTIIGKVFWDSNGNGVQDDGESGYGGTKVLMGDGTAVRVDSNGNFHIPGVRPGTHLLHLKGVPVSWLTTESPCLVRVTPGLLAKANFGVRPLDVERLASPIPFLGDLSLLLLAEGELGRLGVRGAEASGQDARLKDGGYFSGRLTYFLSGRIDDRFVLTSSLDTGRTGLEPGLRYVDPNRYYNEYGDNGSVSFEAANVAGPFYLRVDALPEANLGRSSLLYGSYSAGIEQTELAVYRRTLSGAKVDVFRAPVYSDGRLSLKASGTVFAAQAPTDSGARVGQSSARDEFRATGGSVYYLKHREALFGSERIALETRDRINNLVLANRLMVRGVDYEIDYYNGRLVFRHPPLLADFSDYITSNNTLGGNAVYVTADYEYASNPSGSEGGPYGARLSGELSDDSANKIQLGGTYVSEPDKGGYELKGLDFSLVGPAELFIPVQLSLSAEYAESESQSAKGFLSSSGGLGFNAVSVSGGDGSGSAYKIKAGVKTAERLSVNSYYQSVGSGFVSASSYNYQGSLCYGGAVRYIVSEFLTVNLRLDSQELLRNASIASRGNIGAEKTETGALQGIYRRDKWTVTNEYRYQEAGGRIDGVRTETNADLLMGGLKVDYAFSERSNLYLVQRNVLRGETDWQTTLGAAFGLSERISAKLQVSYGDNGHAFLAGVTRRVSDKTEEFSSVSVSDDGAADTLQASTGAIHQLAPGTSISAQQDYSSSENRANDSVQRSTGATLGHERKLAEHWQFWAVASQGTVHDFDGVTSTKTAREAGSLRLRYANGDAMVFDSKLEARFDRGDESKHQYLTVNTFRHRLNQDWMMSVRGNYSRTDNRTTNQSEALYSETGLGLALRPVKWDRWQLLAKYTHLRDVYPAAQTAMDIATAKSVSDIYALETLYDLSKYFQLVEKYAFKDMKETASGYYETDNNISLWVNRINYNVFKQWYAGAEYRILRQTSGDDRKSGFLVEAMHKTSQNVQLGVGYNFTDFSDDLRRSNNYSASGFFIKINAIIEY
jgi:uncharacterized repeat protein (TIGR01451 family)